MGGSLAYTNVSSLTLEVLKRAGEECARFDLDNWRAPTEDRCFVRMYRCTDNRKETDAFNHNLGDLAWGLSKECRAYGKYLKMHYVEFARVWLWHARNKLRGRSRRQWQKREQLRLACRTRLPALELLSRLRHMSLLSLCAPEASPWGGGPSEDSGIHRRKWMERPVYECKFPVEAIRKTRNNRLRDVH